MKNRGFTLVELLAVLVLISALALITIPSIINYVNKSKDDISEVTKKLIFSGAELYVDSKPNTYAKLEGYQQCVTLKELVDANYLSAPILDSMSGAEIDLNKFVKINYVYNNDLEYYKFNYEIVDSCEIVRIICSASRKITNSKEEYIEWMTNPIVLTPVGRLSTESTEYEPGTEYKCDLGDGVQRTFYVLEDGDNTNLTGGNVGEGQIALITDKNIDSNNYEVDNLDDALLTTTVGWTSEQIVDITLPTYDQISETKNSETLHTWLYYNLYSEDNISLPYGYWTSDNYFVNYTGKITNQNLTKAGIRPIVIVSKENVYN